MVALINDKVCLLIYLHYLYNKSQQNKNLPLFETIRGNFRWDYFTLRLQTGFENLDYNRNYSYYFFWHRAPANANEKKLIDKNI